MDAPRLRLAEPSDARDLAAIYNVYVERTTVTFEETPVPDEEMARRLAAVRAHGLPWLVAEVDGRVVGYAAADRWKARSAYRFAVETSVYLEPQATGRGIGTALCTELLDRLRASPAHAVISGIALPNPASVRLHERLGMRRVATFSQVGFKLGRWVDVAYWQTIFDRNEAGGAPGAPPEKATDSTVSDYGFEP